MWYLLMYWSDVNIWCWPYCFPKEEERLRQEEEQKLREELERKDQEEQARLDAVENER